MLPNQGWDELPVMLEDFWGWGLVLKKDREVDLYPGNDFNFIENHPKSLWDAMGCGKYQLQFLPSPVLSAQSHSKGHVGSARY